MGEKSGRDVVPGFGPALRAAREAAGLSLVDVAIRAGTGSAAVSKVEREERSPSLRMAMALADAVGRDLMEIVRSGERVSAAVEAAGAMPKPKTRGQK